MAPPTPLLAGEAGPGRRRGSGLVRGRGGRGCAGVARCPSGAPPLPLRCPPRVPSPARPAAAWLSLAPVVEFLPVPLPAPVRARRAPCSLGPGAALPWVPLLAPGRGARGAPCGEFVLRPRGIHCRGARGAVAGHGALSSEPAECPLRAGKVLTEVAFPLGISLFEPSLTRGMRVSLLCVCEPHTAAVPLPRVWGLRWLRAGLGLPPPPVVSSGLGEGPEAPGGAGPGRAHV